MTKDVLDAKADGATELLWRWGYCAAAIWIFGTALFFFASFSVTFYIAHSALINAAVDRAGKALGC